MMLDTVTDVLDSLDIPYAFDTFAPGKPPEPPYAVIFDETEYDGSDFTVGYLMHDTTVYLFDTGSRSLRMALSNAFAAANVKHTKYSTNYIYDRKLFSTEYDIAEYPEKWSEEE